jgi:hypothetical protein
MTILKNKFFSSFSTPVFAILWFLIAGIYYFRDWNPLTDHPSSIIIKQSPAFYSDLSAALTTLFSTGRKELAGLTLLLFAAIGCGSLLFSLLKISRPDNRRFILAAGAGTGLLSCYSFGLGILNGYNRTGLLFTFILMTLFALYGAVLCLSSAFNTNRKFKVKYTDIIFLTLLACVMIFLCAKALKPAIFYDAITYHLGVPNYFLLEGGISYIPYDSCSNFPFLAEMLYTLGFLLSGLKLAQLTSPLIFFLTAITLYDFCHRFLKEINPVIAPLFYLVTPAFMEATVFYTNDLHLAYYLLLLIYAFFLFEKEKNYGCIVLMGIFAGFYLSTKYTALISVSGLFAAGFFLTLRKNSGKESLKKAALFALPALLTYLPWMIKNIIYTGNPFYPAMYDLFGGQDMTTEQYRAIMRLAHHPDTMQIFTGIFKNPVMLLFPASWNTSPYGIGWSLGPCIACFLPLIIIIKKVSPLVRKLLFTLTGLFLIWNATFLQTRYLYPAILLSLIVAAYALSRLLKEPSFLLRNALKAGIVFYLFVGFCMGFYAVKARTGTLGNNFIKKPDEKYLQIQMLDNKNALLYSLPIYNYINKNLETNSKILIIGDAQHLYIKRRHVYTYLSGTTPYEIFRTKQGKHADIAAALFTQGITHIVYNPLELERLQKCGAISYKKEDNAAIEDFLKSPQVRLLSEYRRLTLTVTLFELQPKQVLDDKPKS